MGVESWNTTVLSTLLTQRYLTTGLKNVTEKAVTTEAPDTLNDEDYLKDERLGEGLYLMMIALAGISLNIVIFCSVFLCKPLRNYMNGFVIHGCVLDAFKSAMCIPYSLAVLKIASPSFCNALGLAYVVALSVSMFNLLAMVMAEAYAFHERNVKDTEGGEKGAAMCIIFGVVTIYIGSIILHLGPTLIGGEFKFNEDVGNCTFAYGKVQNYIVQVIWVIIVSLTLIVVFRYIYKFYRQLKANQRFRITNLARNAAAYSKGEAPDDDIYELVTRLKKRVRVLLCMASVYCICWYPLFFLTLLDYTYSQPRYLYRILTIVAWSHSAILPIVLLTMDHSFGIVQQFRRALRAQRQRYKPSSPSTQALTRDDSTIHGSQHTSLYNHTMNSSGRAVSFVNSPRPPSQRRLLGEPIKLSDQDLPPPPPPPHPTLELLSDYDALSLEESPL